MWCVYFNVEKNPVKVNTNLPVPVPPRHLFDLFAEAGGKVILLCGPSPVFRFSMFLAAAEAARGRTLAIVDGANRFDIHLLTRFARERALNADQLLARVYLSRGFTCYQMEAALTRKLPPFLAAAGSSKAMVFGLLDTLYDEQAPLRETEAILRRVQEQFIELRAREVTVLLTCKEWNVLPRERNAFLPRLKAAADSVFRLHLQEHHPPRLLRERRGIHHSS